MDDVKLAAITILAGYMVLNMPCTPAAAWIKQAHERGLEITGGDVDMDGDVWIRWRRGSYWWQTLILKKGTILCIAGRRAPPVGYLPKLEEKL